MDSQSCNSTPNHATTASSRAATALIGAREAILDVAGTLTCGAWQLIYPVEAGPRCAHILADHLAKSSPRTPESPRDSGYGLPGILTSRAGSGLSPPSGSPLSIDVAGGSGEPGRRPELLDAVVEIDPLQQEQHVGFLYQMEQALQGVVDIVVEQGEVHAECTAAIDAAHGDLRGVDAAMGQLLVRGAGLDEASEIPIEYRARWHIGQHHRHDHGSIVQIDEQLETFVVVPHQSEAKLLGGRCSLAEALEHAAVREGLEKGARFRRELDRVDSSRLRTATLQRLCPPIQLSPPRLFLRRCRQAEIGVEVSDDQIHFLRRHLSALPYHDLDLGAPIGKAEPVGRCHRYLMARAALGGDKARVGAVRQRRLRGRRESQRQRTRKKEH